MLHLFNMPLIYKTKIDRPRPFRRSRLTMIRALTIRATRENDLAVGQLASALHCGLSLNELSSAGQPGYQIDRAQLSSSAHSGQLSRTQWRAGQFCRFLLFDGQAAINQRQTLEMHTCGPVFTRCSIALFTMNVSTYISAEGWVVASRTFQISQRPNKICKTGVSSSSPRFFERIKIRLYLGMQNIIR